MTTKLEISSAFGTAKLESEKPSIVSKPLLLNEYSNLERTEVKSVKLDFIAGEQWSFSFSFLPNEATEISGNTGQFLDAYLLETPLLHGHVAYRADDWWEYKGFENITVKSLKLSRIYSMTASKRLSIDLKLAFALKNAPSTEDDIETWLAVDDLLHINGKIYNA